MSNSNLLLLQHNKLETERLQLRPVVLSDAEDIYEYTSDDETTRFIFNKHTEIQQTKALIANYYMKEPIGKYALVLKETNKMIGTIEFRVHEHNNSGEIGYTLNRHFWGYGYMTEARKRILALAFSTLSLERVFAEFDVRNIASGKVLERLGMIYEGTLRKNRMVKGVLTDSMHYSILKEEYTSSNER